MNRRMMIKNNIAALELLSDPNSPPTPEVLDLKRRLREEELLSTRNSILWTRDFWAGKIDKPNKHMFDIF